MSQSLLPAKLGPCQIRVTTENGVATISIHDGIAKPASANTFAVFHRLEKWWVTVDALDHCVSDGWVAFPNHADAICPARPMGSNSGLHGIGQTQSSHGLAMLEFPKWRRQSPSVPHLGLALVQTDVCVMLELLWQNCQNIGGHVSHLIFHKYVDGIPPKHWTNGRTFSFFHPLPTSSSWRSSCTPQCHQ